MDTSLDNKYLQAILNQDFEVMNDLLGELHENYEDLVKKYASEKFYELFSNFRNSDAIALQNKEEFLSNKFYVKEVIEGYNDTKRIIEDASSFKQKLETQKENLRSEVEALYSFNEYQSEDALNNFQSDLASRCDEKLEKIKEELKEQENNLFYSFYSFSHPIWISLKPHYIDKVKEQANTNNNEDIEQTYEEKIARYKREMETLITEYDGKYKKDIQFLAEEIKKPEEFIRAFQNELNSFNDLLEDPNLPEWPEFTPQKQDEIDKLDKQITNLEKMVINCGKAQNPTLYQREIGTQTDFETTSITEGAKPDGMAKN